MCFDCWRAAWWHGWGAGLCSIEKSLARSEMRPLCRPAQAFPPEEQHYVIPDVTGFSFTGNAMTNSPSSISPKANPNYTIIYET
jgi:hypothetical protein